MERRRILIVDDEPDIVTTMKLALEMEGYDVITAYDGRAALEKIYTHNPNLIVLDIMLPEIDGYEVSRRLKCDENYKHISLIILTAHAQKKDVEIGERLGADIYMVKPFNQDELNCRIKEILDRKSKAMTIPPNLNT